MNFNRKAYQLLLNALQAGKVIKIIGARRVGKTQLIRKFMKETTIDFLYLSGEDFSTYDLLERRTIANYKSILGDKRLLIIDEAQKINDIGNILKLMVDEIEGLMVIVTGSSAFDINSLIGEPLTGRSKTILLYPISEEEIDSEIDVTERKDYLYQRLIFGSYPEIFSFNNIVDKTNYLREVVNSYLLKDILAFENLKNSQKILDLLKSLAFQVGSEVSIQELGNSLGISKNTVERYLDLLSKVFVIYNVRGFSRNLRKEINKLGKWYFYDNGLRNILIANTNNIKNRGDIGQLWENFIFSERIKYQNNQQMLVNNYFWRTYDGQEIDLIEEREGNLFAYEFKWNKYKIKPPQAFTKNYEDATFELIHPNNYQSFIK